MVHAMREHAQEELRKLENQRGEIDIQIGLLNRLLAGSPTPSTKPTLATPTTPGTTKRRGRKVKGSDWSIPGAIMHLVGQSDDPMGTREIINSMQSDLNMEFSDSSVYSAVNRLRKSGALVAKPFQGRGDAYIVGDVSKADSSTPAPTTNGSASKESSDKDKAEEDGEPKVTLKALTINAFKSLDPDEHHTPKAVLAEVHKHKPDANPSSIRAEMNKLFTAKLLVRKKNPDPESKGFVYRAKKALLKD